jgi:predicted phosphoribosyltransferase
LRSEVDELVCPYQPEPFGAVGFFYRHFEPVEDVQVQELLEEANAIARLLEKQKPHVPV